MTWWQLILILIVVWFLCIFTVFALHDLKMKRIAAQREARKGPWPEREDL